VKSPLLISFLAEWLMLTADFQALIAIFGVRWEIAGFLFPQPPLMHLFIMNKVTTVKMEVWKISPKVSNGHKVYS
jgi:hypothetical protein